MAQIRRISKNACSRQSFRKIAPTSVNDGLFTTAAGDPRETRAGEYGQTNKSALSPRRSEHFGENHMKSKSETSNKRKPSDRFSRQCRKIGLSSEESDFALPHFSRQGRLCLSIIGN
jgi:hypothetical protein